jgi:hypothetical protein
MARRRPGARRLTAAVRGLCCAAAITVAAGGCALVSPSGNVHEVSIPQAGNDQNQEQPQLIPTGPGQGWTPIEIVNGFLGASASFTNHYAIAREYLTPTEASSWQPDGSVAVVGNLQGLTPPQNEPKRQPDQPSNKVTHVNVLGTQLATLTGTGQYLASSGSGLKTSAAAKNKFVFTLVNVNDNWRISQLQRQQPASDGGFQLVPQQQLMLSKDELERVYQQRNLYFLDPAGRILVPDPVFVPQNDTISDLAARLVKGLFKDPQGWLAGAARTAFPRGTVTLGPVRINGPNATVDLGMPAAAEKAMKPAQLDELAAQLVWTLTSTSYGPAAIQIVQIQLNGRTLALSGSLYQRPKLYQRWLPGQIETPGPYFISRTGQVKELTSAGLTAPPQTGPVKFSASSVAGQAGTLAAPALSDIAIEPDQSSIAGLSQDRKTVYIGDLNRDAEMSAQHPGGTFNSLSWDRMGDLWAVGDNSVWMLTPGSGSTGINPSGFLQGGRLTAFRVAPDGIRVAMIVQHGASSQLLLAAISRDGPAASIGDTVVIGAQIPSPQDLTWYDADHLIVLMNPGAKAQLEEVPLNGGQPSAVSTVPGTTSVTSDGGALAAGLSNGGLAVTPILDAPWQQAGKLGGSPAYPG